MQKEKLIVKLLEITSATISREDGSRVSIKSYDLRKTSEAEKIGVKPGYYFNLYPISRLDLNDESLMHKFSVVFCQKLESEQIPSEGWVFEPVGYLEEYNLLITKASMVEQ
ncbi:MAG: hypothetical protein QY322_00460 [bacterium]|nr:MAG: hypothetical protein QY322_00460 [bacterium]